MRAMLIVNPHATSTTARRRDLLAHALAAEVDLSVEHTADRGHAAELAAKAAQTGAALVVVHGGDGTVNEVVNGIMAGAADDGARPMLAVVPGGSTNVFARAIGVDPDPTAATEQVLDALATGRPPVTASLGMADDRYFTFNAGLGLDAEVVAAVEEDRAAGATVTNALHVRKTVRRFLASDRRRPRLTVEIPGRPPVTGAHLLFVSNVDPWTYWEGRPIRTNPGTSARRGLGVFALRSLGVPTVVRVVGQLVGPGSGRPDARGPHGRAVVRDDDVPLVRAVSDRPIGLQVDGDYLGLRPGATFRGVPDALRVLGPQIAASGGGAGAGRPR
ncbi:diacylglycerol/lipid kinase family protein [Nakamurella endophytica]|uniref:Diacylglycerol kinase n=1 Tax=Nakamurella endophytica TaxID=1748367 RepID=A0A917SLL5_9ACTN|nr:diacylglycerol kinase family protein [Nakamurella endophytica]GGL85802.1 diacylglycerol kinase [Nakamurella endophytica]